MPRASRQIASLFSLLTTVSILTGAKASHSCEAAAEPRASLALTTPVVAIQPLGEVDPGLVQAVAERVRRTFAVDVVVLPTKPLPRSAFYPPRMRFRGERLVDWLEAMRPPRVATTLGLMSHDLSVTKGSVYDWGVMGVAGLSRPAGVVSTRRMSRDHATASRVRQRACQVAVHELGHTFGLAHCRTPHCIMNDAEGGIASVDRSSGMFCPSCAEKLGSLLRH